jgi:hypothetical protein
MNSSFQSGQRWLILSHAFNMDGRAASQTITDKIPHLLAQGIQPVVVSGVLGQRDQVVPHYMVLPLGPAALRFDLRHLARKVVGKGLGYSLLTGLLSLVFAPFIALEKIIWGRQSHWTWSWSAYLMGLWLIRKHHIDCIYSTGGAYSAHLAGLWLKRSTKLPLIVEVHDPLVFRGQQVETRDARYQAKLEGQIAEHADLAWWFAAGALATAQERHPKLHQNGIVIIPGANPPVIHAEYVRGNKLVMAHFGSLSNTRSLNRFLMALAQCVNQQPAMADDLEVHIYGIELDELSEQVLVNHPELQPMIKRFGRLEFDKASGLSGRERVMQRMQQADVLLMAHGEIENCAEYIPSKLYEYFWARRPVFGFTHLNPQIDAFILERGGFVANACITESIGEKISLIHDEWIHNKLFLQVQNAPLDVSATVTMLLSICSLRKIVK